MQELSERLKSLQLNSMTLDEITELTEFFSQPKYRARQLFSWLSKGTMPMDMLNLPMAFRKELDAIPFGKVSIYAKRKSMKDDTVKYLFELGDGNIVEGVLMRYSYGNTLCLSTQVGCRMGCAFCASTLEGCVRSLTSGEILQTVNTVEADNPAPEGKRCVTNIVLMGSGEPLDNYDNVVRFLHLITCPDGFNMSSRNISLSTCGLVDRIYTFVEDAPHVTLSISLHAPNDELRSSIMPINKKYPIASVLEAAKYYANTTKRRVIFEYALISGKNDDIVSIRELAHRLRGINCHVNLIPLNKVVERKLFGTSRADAYKVQQQLEDLHISATVRREMGADIDGACGQLRRRAIKEKDREET